MAPLQLNSLFFEALSWWKNCSNFIFFTITIIFLSSWYSFIFTKKSKNNSPPLPPGPRGLPVLGNLLSLKPELHKYFTSLSKKYGPIFSLKLGTKFCVVVNSPETTHEILRDQDVVFANRDPPAVTEAIFGANDIVWKPYGPEWRKLRKVCVKEMLSTTVLDAAYHLRQCEIRKLVSYLYKNAGSQVNIGKQIFMVTFDIMASMLWGGNEEAGETVAEFQQVIADMTYLLGAPNVSDFFPILAPLDLQGRLKQMRRIVAKLEGIYDELIDRKEKMGGGGKDLLEVLLELKHGGDAIITMNHVKALLTDFLVGGTDTSSSTIEFVMSELINNSRVMAKAQAELDTVIGKKNTVEESHINKLPYLNAIIKESLRLHPVIPNLVPHRPSKPCIVGGFTIPKGTCVFINTYKIHRDPLIWKDPEEFYPERFLNGEIDSNVSDFRYIPFGSGRRICAGMALAERILALSLATLLHSFDWKAPNGERLDITEKFGIVLKKKSPLVAIPVPRLSEPQLYE